jgi:hypothetical protein
MEGFDYNTSLAFFGNSFLYYNDSPRLIQQMVESAGYYTEQDSCLRGGSSITSIWENGCTFTSNTGPESVEDLLSAEGNWDFVIIDDNTQGPARDSSRERSISTLTEDIVPLLWNNDYTRHSIPILIQTPAHRHRGVAGSSDLGSFYSFSDLVAKGVRKYKQAIDAEFTNYDYEDLTRIAPVGEAFRWLRVNDFDLFDKLYSWDDIHPSPYGTWLQACVIFCTCFPDDIIPKYNPEWWDLSRYMMPVSDDGVDLDLPSKDDASKLRRVARDVCDDYSN